MGDDDDVEMEEEKKPLRPEIKVNFESLLPELLSPATWLALQSQFGYFDDDHDPFEVARDHI